MKTCKGCIHAVWDRTKDGKLHPSGRGGCNYPYAVPELPESMYWLGKQSPRPSGGFISRGEEFTKDCIYFMDKKSVSE